MRLQISSGFRAAVAILALAAFSDRGLAQEPVLDAKAIEKVSAAAISSSDHERAAKQYRLRAESLEKKADQHEANARRMSQAHNPMAHKWPALGRAPEEREKRLAMQARRAAQECLAQAERHTDTAAALQRPVSGSQSSSGID